MILVTGATGHLGSAIIDFIKQADSKANVAALARNKDKVNKPGVEVREGDYDDYPSLVNAFQGVEKLFLVSSSDVQNRSKQQENAINAAKEAGVKHIFYTSIPFKTLEGLAPLAPVADSHLETERLIKASGLAYTILRNNLYLDIVPLFVGENVLESKQIFFPAGNEKVSFISRKDLAEISAKVLLNSNQHLNQTYDLNGSKAYSFDDIAQTLSDITGEEIRYTKPSLEEYQAGLSAAGVPADGIFFFSMFAQAIANGEFNLPSGFAEKILARPTESITTFLKSVYGTK